MTTSDLIGVFGASTLPIAFVPNQRRVISERSRPFPVMKLVGALMCGHAAWLVRTIPFVVREHAWATVALRGLLRRPPQRRLGRENNSDAHL